MNNICVFLLLSCRVFNAFNDSGGDFKVMLTTGSGELTACAQDEFETDELGFMGVSNRSKVTVGRFVHAPPPPLPSPLSLPLFPPSYPPVKDQFLMHKPLGGGIVATALYISTKDSRKISLSSIITIQIPVHHICECLGKSHSF